MNIDEFDDQISTYINYTHEDESLEFEAVVKNNYNNPINKSNFSRIMSRMKALKIVPKVTEILDIFYEFKPGSQSNIRISVKGGENIRRYCQTNDFSNIDPKFISFIRKKRVIYSDIDPDLAVANQDVFLKPIDIDEYSLRLNLKSEQNMTFGHEHVKSALSSWKNKRKLFRFKKRYSFKIDKNFQYDLTLVKNSNFNIVDNVDRKIKRFIYVRTLQESGVLENDADYEIELEYIGNNKKVKDNIDVVLKHLKKNLSFILQSLQKSYFLISKSEKIKVKEHFSNLLKLKKYKGFQGPNPVTIEPKFLSKKGYVDYQDTLVNIRRDFCVTEKADGERNILVTLEDGSMYLINRKNDIKNLGAKCNYVNSIIDGEYITKDKEGNNINYFMAFDIYVDNEVETKNLVFYDDENDSRYNRLKTLEDTLVVENLANNNLKFLVKKYMFGDFSQFDSGINNQIIDIEAALATEKDETNIKRYNDQLKELYSDSKIFENSKYIYQKEYVYHIDGLIFMPNKLKVGEDLFTGETKFNGRWFMNFKWKPPEENTIDFLVYFEKDVDSPEKDKIGHLNISEKLVPYKYASLNVGYDPEIHTKYNACRVLNENITYKAGYYPTKFFPNNPYKKDVHMCKIEIKDQMTKAHDGNFISDGSIVEFKYDPDSEFKWIPLRVRDVNAPNDFLTASNVWTSINNPVTENMICGTDVSLEKLENIVDIDTYYLGAKKRSERLSKPMNDFHSYIKKKLIKDNSRPNNNLIDLSCGKLGDLNHWTEANISTAVAIDISKDNFDNIYNGSCIRILNQLSERNDNPLLNNILLIWGDSSKDLITGAAGLDELNQHYLKILFSKIYRKDVKNKKLKTFYGLGNEGFDIASCQFSIHYFHKNEDILEQFLVNVSNVLKEGGLFITTCLDGNLLFDMLKSNPVLEGRVDDEVVWRIIKKYDVATLNNDSSCLGLPIDVFIETINQTLTEYLVNIDYLIILAKKYNLELIKRENFREIHDKISDEDNNYGSLDEFIRNEKYDDLRTYSFMNTTLSFKKI